MRIPTILVIIATASALSSCTEPNRAALQPAQSNIDSLRSDLLNADMDFSSLSEEKGQSTAFAEYAADSAVLLRNRSMPRKGREAIVQQFAEIPDSVFKLTWSPISADIASSGDMGYTYGTYTLQRMGQVLTQGTYCTIWSKNTAGRWKFVLDTGNEGLSAVKPKPR